MNLDWALVIVAALASSAYGLILQDRPVSGWRAAVKAAAVGALAVLAALRQGPAPLIAALATCAAGDALLALAPQLWRGLGLSVLALAGLDCAGLFLVAGGGRGALVAEPWRGVGPALALGLAAGLGLWIWDRGAPERTRLIAHLAALALAVVAAFTLPRYLWPAVLGALCLLASGALQAIELSRPARAKPAGRAVWPLHFAAQALIAWAFLS